MMFGKSSSRSRRVCWMGTCFWMLSRKLTAFATSLRTLECLAVTPALPHSPRRCAASCSGVSVHRMRFQCDFSAIMIVAFFLSFKSCQNMVCSTVSSSCGSMQCVCCVHTCAAFMAAKFVRAAAKLNAWAFVLCQRISLDNSHCMVAANPRSRAPDTLLPLIHC